LDSVRVGVIGVGYLGQHHARIYSELPGVELVGVVDIDRDRAKEVAERYSTSAFFDYRDLFGKVDADARSPVKLPTRRRRRWPEVRAGG